MGRVAVVPFRQITIWGLGLMGGSLAAALKARGYGGKITGISSTSSVSRATEAGFVDDGYPHDEYEAGVANADLVILASPINTILCNLEKLGPVLQPGTVVTDVGSTKAAIVQHARAVLGDEVTFIGGHPMAGSESQGITAADAYLYENAVWVLTPDSKGASGGSGLKEAPRERTGNGDQSDALSRLMALAEFVGAKVVVTDPVRHDRIAARISHLPQTLAIALMNLAGDWHEEDDLTLRLAAGGFRDLTRIASSPFEMWSDIYNTNRDGVLEAVDDMIERLQELRADVAGDRLSDLFERANRLRLNVPHDTKGFLRPLQDVMVVVQDEPGVLSRIAGTLSTHSINIRDIEVLKVRVGEGGTMRLAFDSLKEAEAAVGLLAQEGFQAWVRE